ncbi:MAG: SapC family protein [Pseudohongiella sp.]|nr:SapC family protein [Pseudohongiella sp.]
MPTLEILSPQTHGDKYWKRATGYHFASKDAIAPLSLIELSRVILSLPIGFVANDHGYVLVAVQGLNQQSNLLVDSNGRWKVPHVPACYRTYPFQLATTADQQLVVCFDVDSNLLSTDGSGERFFDEMGVPSDAVKELTQFLQQVYAGRIQADRVCKVFKELELIKPWEITINSDEGVAQNVEGLFCINEAKLNALDANDLLALRNAGALAIAYCQLLSMQHIASLVDFAAKKYHADKLLSAAQGDLPVFADTGTLNFDML